ncbi:MAG: GlxA family transcriptional regulator [Pseudomonadota bacterium]
MTTLKVVVLLFDGVNAIDITGPLEAFAAVTPSLGRRGYDIATWSLDGEPVRTEYGLRFLPDRELSHRARADILLIPGGEGIRQPDTLSALSAWLARHHHRFRRVVSVCTGAYALAEAGLLRGRDIATHWAQARDLAERYPDVNVDADALFLKDDKFYTSGGVTAGIDLALELIADDYGHDVASAVARELVVFVRRSGKQAQFSEPLRVQNQAPDRLVDVCRWAASHLDRDLSVASLARRASLSPRQLTRRFKDAYGTSPAAVIRRLRIDAARTLLEQGVAVQKVAATVGFASVDGFRRAFLDVLGVTPRVYGERFGSGSAQ